MPDFSAFYNTPIPAEKLGAFQKWLGKSGKAKDYYDYDIQGYWLSGAANDPRGHGSDEFKKPNHPTFSIESKYSTPQNPGGQWVKGGGRDFFVAHPSNLIHHSPEELQSYFKQIEPNTNLIMPPQAPPPARPLTPTGIDPSVFRFLGGLR